MKAYLIDPAACTISEVEIDASNDSTMLRSFYAHMKCRYIEAVNPFNAKGDVIYLDEEGKSHPSGEFFCRLWPHEVLTGRAIWIGVDGEGTNIAPRMPLDYVAAHIVWMA